MNRSTFSILAWRAGVLTQISYCDGVTPRGVSTEGPDHAWCCRKLQVVTGIPASQSLQAVLYLAHLMLVKGTRLKALEKEICCLLIQLSSWSLSPGWHFTLVRKKPVFASQRMHVASLALWTRASVQKGRNLFPRLMGMEHLFIMNTVSKGVYGMDTSAEFRKSLAAYKQERVQWFWMSVHLPAPKGQCKGHLVWCSTLDPLMSSPGCFWPKDSGRRDIGLLPGWKWSLC